MRHQNFSHLRGNWALRSSWFSGLLLALVLLWVISWFGAQQVERHEREHLAEYLDQVLQRAHHGLTYWRNDSQAIARQHANSPTLHHQTEFLLARHQRREDLLSSPAQALLHEYFAPLLEAEQYRGYAILAPDNLSISSSHDNDLGVEHPMTSQPELLARLWAGNTATGHPMLVSQAGQDAGQDRQSVEPTIYVGAPILDAKGAVVALLLLDLDPAPRLYDLLQQARTGESGETYIFNRQGLLLSESRFTQQIMRIGLLNPEQHSGSALRLEVRDPGYNLMTGERPAGTLPATRPLTRMADNAIRSGAGHDLKGYRDYRGVPVVGAWLWDQELEIGLTTELDVAEIYAPLRRLQLSIYGGTLLVSVIMLLAAWMFTRGQLRLNRVQARLDAVFEHAVDGMVVINSKGVIENANEAVIRLFGYELQELIGQNVSLLMPEPHRSQHDRYLARYLAEGNPQIIGIGREVEGMSKDGAMIPFDLSISEIRVADSRYFAGIIHDLSDRKEIEQALEAERQFNADTLNGLATPIAVLDETGMIVFVNAHWQDLAGASCASCTDQTQGKNFLKNLQESTGNKDAEAITHKLRRMLSGELNSFKYEFPCHGPYAQRWLLMHAACFEHRGTLRAAVSVTDVTERVQAHTALQDRESTLNQAQALAHLGNWDWDIQQGTLTWSDEIYRIFDLDPQSFDCSYEAFMAKVHPDDRTRLNEAIEQALMHKAPYEIDHRICLPDGSVRFVREQGEVDRDDQGNPLRMLGTIQDITEQQKLMDAWRVAKDQALAQAEKLIRSETVLRMALEGVGAGVWNFDVASGAVDFDTRTLDIYGLADDQFAGDYAAWAERVHPDDLEDTEAEFQRSLDNAHTRNFTLEYRIIRPDGKLGYLEATGSIERDADGVALAVHGLHFDLTERWQAQQELLAAKRSLESANRDLAVTQQAMDQAGQAMFWFDASSGRLLKASDFTCDLLGYARDELLVMNLAEIEPEMIPGGLGNRIESLRQKGYGRFESQFLTKNDELLSVEMLAFYRAASRGLPATVIVFASDITERKQAEADLIMAREEAEAANRSKSAFLAAMSHEIRTPMNGIVGMADLLSNTRLDEDQRSMLGTVTTSALSLRGIIDDILDFSKIEAGKLSLESIPLSPIILGEEVVNTLAPLMEEKQIDCLLDIDPDINGTFLGDPVRIRQILFNLGSNAIKFTHNEEDRAGCVHICLKKTANVSDGRAGLSLSVKDNGIGISPQAQMNLFNAFTQAENSTTRRYGGTGLGLAISRQLARLMGGDISVDSQPGVGSEFTLHLSLPVVDDKDGLLEEGWQLEGTRLLLAGLDDNLADSLGTLLKHYGVQVSCCHLDEAATVIEQSLRQEMPYQVIVTDSKQLGESAEQVHAHLRQVAGEDARFILLLPRSRKPVHWPRTYITRSRPMLPRELLHSLAITLGQATPLTETAQAMASDEASSHQQRILVAEDNETNRNVISRQLKVLGYPFEMAEDGAAALALWRQGNFDLLLTDCHMPEMDGYTLSRAIRDSEKGSNSRLPIIAVTANAIKGEAERCFEAGMDDYLAKPVELNQLRNMLDKWLETVAQPTDETSVSADDKAVTEQAESSAPVNPQALADIIGDDPDVIRTFLKEFIPQSQAVTDNLSKAFEAGDADRVRFFAHQLKSASRAVGADELADLSLELETAGRQEDWPAINKLYASMQTVSGSVIDYIRGL